MEKHSPWYIINHGHDFGKLFVPVSGSTAKFSVHCCVCAPEERSGCYVISIHCCPCTACVTVLYTCAPAFNKYALLKSSSPCKIMVIYCDVILRDLGKSPYPTVIFKQLASLFTFYTLTADKSKFLFSKNKIGSRIFEAIGKILFSCRPQYLRVIRCEPEPSGKYSLKTFCSLKAKNHYTIMTFKLLVIFYL